jgi:hypothetical protein
VKVVDIQQVSEMPVNLPEAYHQGYFHDLSGVDNLRSRPHVLHGVPNILVEKTPLPWFMTMMEPPYSDEFLLRDLTKTAKSESIQRHHPETRQVIFDSFSNFPELQHHYLRS